MKILSLDPLEVGLISLAVYFILFGLSVIIYYYLVRDAHEIKKRVALEKEQTELLRIIAEKLK